MSCPSPATGPTPLEYPDAERLELVETLHGHEVADPYRWLEDPDDPRTQAWSQAQDDLLADQAAQWPGRQALVSRLTELLGSGVVGVPIWRRESADDVEGHLRRFFIRREGHQEHGVLYVVDNGNDPSALARVLIDPMVLDPTGSTTLDAWQPSRDGALLAYQVSEGGTEESVLLVVDVTTGELVDGPIDRARYSPVSWIPGGLDGTPAYYYVRRLAPDLVPAEERQYHRRVWLHRVGSEPASDVEIFGEGHDPRTYFGAGVSRDGRWLTVSASVGTAPRNDVWIADLSDPAGSHEAPVFTPLATGLDAQTGASVGRDGRLYVFTDLDAPRGRLAVADPSAPEPENWRDLIPHDPEAVLEDFTVLDGPELDQPLLLAAWTRHAVSEITVHDLVSGDQLAGDRGRIDLPGVGSTGGLVSRPEGGHEAWFSYTDQVSPPHVYRLDGRTLRYELYSSPPGTVEVPSVVTQQVEYTSRDGTTVRMFVTARADLLDRDGAPLAPLPTILYGYGGFAVSMTPAYSATVLAWAEAGGCYATANLRGGSEEGEQWHRAGMLAEKQNVFDDFHAAAEKLLADGWTTTDRLAINGGSNGGLLVGAALTQRPDLFTAVVCSAPLLDMVRYERFGLGATWNVEYGSADDPRELGWLLAYSPYHHVVQGTDYPATLFTVFDGDSRVDPFHARKLCAALQYATSGSRPILIRREKNVGHGARANSKTIQLSADTLTFMAAQTGLELAGHAIVVRAVADGPSR
jgi:prolyl oligopeptidase